MLVWESGSAPLEWLREGFAIAALALVHEDMAAVTTGMLVTERGLPVPVAWTALFTGVLFGDLMIYGVGALARKVPWLRRRMISPRVEQVGRWLDHHLLRAVALCKVTPGILFPTFIACGWFRLSFRRFAAACLAAALVYTTATLTLVVVFGHALLRHFGVWMWAVAALLVLLLSTVSAGRPNRWRRVAAGVTLEDVPAAAGTRQHWLHHAREHLGMPSLRGLRRRIAKAERIAPVFFYVPIGLRWCLLGLRHRSLTLPTAANPCIEGGGFWGESKSAVLRQIGDAQQCWVAPFVTVDRHREDAEARADLEATLGAVGAAGLEFPLVVKPDIGWQGFGVRVVADAEALRAYLAQYPVDERLIVQRFVPYDGEAAVFYVRKPGDQRGRILSMTLRYFPHVTGDGVTPLRDLILRDPRAGWKSDFYLGVQPAHSGLSATELNDVPPEGRVVRLSFIGSQRVGGLYRDGTREVTPALEDRFEAIARSMPEFYYGRFDVRFKSLESLRLGEAFAIFEVNGAGAEDIHVWDPETSIWETYRELFHAQTLLFDIGAMNRARGFAPTSPRAFLRMLRRQHRLDQLYPPSA